MTNEERWNIFIRELRERSAVFKGQSVACLYNEHFSGLRQSGDIDIYVDCGREKTLEYRQSFGMKDIEWDYVHTHAQFF